MKNMKTAVLVCVLAVGAAGCTTTQGPQEQAGMVIGGVLGGLLGAQVDDRDLRTVAIIAGTMAGAAIGGAVGESMDETDRLKAAQSLEGVRTGVSSTWKNPDTGVEYQFTPTKTYESGSGPCREYTMEAIIGGKTETVYGTACRQADGTWMIQG
jgi:surface antigen